MGDDNQRVGDRFRVGGGETTIKPDYSFSITGIHDKVGRKRTLSWLAPPEVVLFLTQPGSPRTVMVSDEPN